MCRRCDAFAEQSISVTPRNLGSNPSRLVKISIRGVKLIFAAGFELSPKAKFESRESFERSEQDSGSRRRQTQQARRTRGVSKGASVEPPLPLCFD